MSTPEEHRAEAADYTDLAKQGNAPDEVRNFLRHEQSLIMLADNEQWLAENHDKAVHAPVHLGVSEEVEGVNAPVRPRVDEEAEEVHALERPRVSGEAEGAPSDPSWQAIEEGHAFRGQSHSGPRQVLRKLMAT